jgi:outer membrane protein assembly factor BamB
MQRRRSALARRRFGVLAATIALVATALTPVIAMPSPAVAASYQDWPTFLHDAGRSAATADPNLSIAKASLLKLKWSYATGGPIATSASIVGTTAYVGSWNGNEYAINTATGAVIWQQNLGLTNDARCHPPTLGITSAAAVVNGVVYVGGGDAYWYALDANTGAVLWKVFTGDTSNARYNWASPLIVNGAAYIGIASNCDNPLVQGQLLKVDLASHQVVATYKFVPDGQVGGGIWTSPTLDAVTNTIFVSTGTLNDYRQTQSQAIVALDAATLQYKSSWQLPFAAAVTDSDWGNTPTLTTDSGGRKLLSVANKNGVIYTFNRNNLAAGPIWQRSIAIGGDCPTCGDGTIASGIFANGVLYYAGGNNVINGHGSGGSIRALDPGTGAVMWTRQTDSPILGSPAYVNGLVALAEGSTFEVLNAANGALLYSYVLGAPVYGAVSIARSQFYVGAVDGLLYAFGIGTANAAPPADPNCPSGFTCEDIRKPLAGSEQTTNGVLTVTASGAAIHGTADQYRSIGRLVTGDSQSSVTIVSQSTQNKQPQAGLMVRQAYGTSTDQGAPFFAVLAYPNDLTEGLPQPMVVIWYRSQFGKNSIELTKWYPANKPVSVMIQRAGNFFSAGISFDGTNFQLIPGASVNIDMPATTLQGLAVDSGATTNYGTASFTNLSVGGPVVTPMALQPPVHPCPTSWTCQDIGNPNPPGDTTAAGNSLNLAGTGLGFGGATDSLHYVFQSVSGNQAISAQVVTGATASNAQAGLMMRASTLASAPMYSVYLKPGGSATVQWRVNDGITYRKSVPIPTVTSPAYLQILRFQDTRFNPPITFFGTMTSPDGVSWTPVLGSSVAIDMGSGPYLAGLAATTAVARATTPATFNNVAFSTPPTPPPGICPDEFTCQDVGIQSLPSNEVFLNNTWTMMASGSDIWGNYDTFHFAYQDFPNDPANSINGDGTISARVVSQTNVGGPWMKSGVMIRAGTDPQAPYYGVFVTPGNGVAVQWRGTQADQTTQTLATGVQAPAWVLASRYTDTAHGNIVYYSAFISTDGVNFTYVPGSTVSLDLPAPLVAGIATDSYDSGKTSVATFDNVASLPGSQPPPFICPAAWTCADLGGALPPGQDQLTSSGTWNEIGGGGDIWGTADAFHFVWQTLPGNGTASAHLTAQQQTDPWAKAGPMLRTSTDPGSPYYAAFVTPANGVAIQWRAAQGGSSNQVLVPGAVPAYLMVDRFTTTGANPQTFLAAYKSDDGNTWTAVAGSVMQLGLTGPLLGGFAITSHNQGTGSAVTLDSVAVTSTDLAPPGVCPADWQCADLGGATPSGGQDLSNGTWTINGGGGDIWDTADSFRYTWQSMSGDGTLSAQVLSQSNTNDWAKAGVMLRQSTDPGSPYYAVFVTPANGVAVQWRDTLGNFTSQVTTPGAPAIYLQITRTGTTFSAATSSDGVTWTPVPNSVVNLPNLSGSLLSGLAVTSHDTGALSTVLANSVVVTP